MFSVFHSHRQLALRVELGDAIAESARCPDAYFVIPTCQRTDG